MRQIANLPKCLKLFRNQSTVITLLLTKLKSQKKMLLTIKKNTTKPLQYEVLLNSKNKNDLP